MSRYFNEALATQRSAGAPAESVVAKRGPGTGKDAELQCCGPDLGAVRPPRLTRVDVLARTGRVRPLWLTVSLATLSTWESLNTYREL
jgi:hypothetical protein